MFDGEVFKHKKYHSSSSDRSKRTRNKEVVGTGGRRTKKNRWWQPKHVDLDKYACSPRSTSSSKRAYASGSFTSGNLSLYDKFMSVSTGLVWKPGLHVEGGRENEEERRRK